MKIKYFSSFGYNAKNSGHHFQVDIPDNKEMEVRITEHYEDSDLDGALVSPELIKTRVILSRDHWELIAQKLRHEFNQRLKQKKGKPISWKNGRNKISRSLGKELVVLAWAIENAPLTAVDYAVANWLGLAPEERWWLYTQANAATGDAIKGRGRGWRKAIEIALTENPVGGLGRNEMLPREIKEPNISSQIITSRVLE